MDVLSFVFGMCVGVIAMMGGLIYLAAKFGNGKEGGTI